MLKDELRGLEDLAGRPSAWDTQLAAAAAYIKDAWAAVFFSDTDQDIFRRYWRYHLDKLVFALNREEASDATPYTEMLCEMLEHLLSLLPGLINENITAPQHWLNWWRKREAERYRKVRAELTKFAFGGDPAEPLLAFFDEIVTSQKIRCNFMTLAAADRLFEAVSTLTSGQEIAERLDSVLYYHNFNHLGYFLYRCGCFKTMFDELPDSFIRLEKLRQEQFLASAYQPVYPPCLPEWPSVSVMISTWLAEEAESISNKPITAPIEKIHLNTSVAHLAFWLRQLYEEGVFGNLPLVTLFKGAAKYCSTKRQPDISPGSLSKEYYSPSQVTAGKVLAMLRHISTRINNQFFPLLIAASTVFCA